MRLNRRAAFYILLGLLVAALGLLVLGWFPQETLRSWVESRLQAGLGPGSRIRRMHVVPGRLRVDVYDLVIESPEYRLEIPRARAVLTRGFVLRRDLAFRLVEMESPTLRLHPRPRPDRPRPPLRDPLNIDRLLVTGGTITYDLPPPQPDVFVLRGVELQGSVGRGTLEASARYGEWQGRARPIMLGAARGVFRLSPWLEIGVDSLQAGTQASQLGVVGTLGRAGDLAPDLRFQGRLALDDVERFQGTPPELSGAVTVEGRLHRADEALVVEARVQGGGLRVAGWPLARADARLEHATEPAGRTTFSASLALLGGSAQADARIEGKSANLRLRFSGIEAAQLESQGVSLGVPFRGRLGGDLTGRGSLRDTLWVQGTIRADGRTGPDMAVEARLVVSGRVRPQPRTVDVGFTLDLDGTRRGQAVPRLAEAHLVARGKARGALPPAVEATFDGRLLVRTARGSETVPVQGQARVRRGAAVVDMTARGLGGSLKAFLETRGAVARQLRMEGSSLDLAGVRSGAAGSVSFSFAGSGPFERLSGDGQARVEDLVWNGARVGDVKATLRGSGGRAHVVFEAPELRATGEGTADRRGFRGTLVLNQTPLEPIRPLLNQDRPLAGVLSGTVDVELPWSRPSASVVRARLEQLELASGELTARARAPFTLTARSGRLDVQDLELEGPGLVFRGSGRLGLGAQAPLDLAGRIELDLARLPAAPGWQLTGRVEGQVDLAGTIARPRATGQVRLQGIQVQRPGFPLITVADGVVDLQGDSATIRELHASWDGGRVDLLGRVPLSAVLTAAQAERLGLAPGGAFNVEASFDADLARWPVRPGWAAQGHVQGDLEFVGTRSRPRAFGLITLQGVALDAAGDRVLSVPEGRVELAGDVAATPGLEARVAGGSLLVSGSVPLAALLAESTAAALQLAPGEADLRLTWSGVEAGKLLEALRPGRPSPMAAALAGEARLAGRLTARESLRGELTLAATTARVQDVAIEVAPLTLRLEGGRVTTDGLTLSGPGGTFRADGALDLRAQTVEATGRGTLELRALSPLVEEALLTGTAQVDLAVSGPLRNPQPRGTVEVQDGSIRLRDIRQPLSSLAARLVFENGSVRVEQASARFGGGPVGGSGSGQMDGLKLTSINLQATGSDMGLRYPVGSPGRSRIWEEFKARVDANLTLTGRPGDFQLSGSVVVERGLYDADIFLEEGLLPPEVPPAPEQPSRFLRSVGLNIAVVTENPILIRNNLAQLEAVGSLWLRGDMDEPAPFGRLEIRPGGKVFLQEREFTISSGNLVYGGTTNPDISVRAETVIKDVEVARSEIVDLEVTLVAQGPLDRPGVDLSSNPSLSQQEIASLIATGQRSVVLSSGASLVGQQAAALLAGRFTREVARGLLELGFDTVDIQPELIALEGDPGARFTFGKQLSNRIKLIYSLGLNNPEAQYYQVQFRSRGRDFNLRVQRTEDGTYAYSVGQRLRFGGARRPDVRETEPARLREVRFEGDLREFEPALRKVVRARAGRRLTYWDLLDDADRIREYLVREGYLEAIIETRLEEDVATFEGFTGPHYRWRVEGMADPPDLTPQVRGALFEEEALGRGRERLLEELRRRGHLRANVETQVVSEAGYRTLVFMATPGPPLQAQVSFPGAQALSPAELLDAAGGAATLLTAPREAREGIRAAYRAKHYFTTEVEPPEVAEQGGVVRVSVPIKEGPQGVVAAVRFPGATLPATELEPLTGIETGQPYDVVAATEAVRRLRDHYLALGYPAVRVTPSVAPAGQDLEVVFRIAEGPRVEVGPVVIKGLRRTRESLVRNQIDLKPGEPLDPRRLAELERRLRDLGVFSRAVVTASQDDPATLTIELEEDARYGLAYDLRYDQLQGASAIVDGEMRNLAGRGMVLSARVRAGGNIREGRLAFHVPSLFLPRLGRAGDLTATVFRREEKLTLARELVPGEPPAATFEDTRSEQGLHLEQALHVFHPWELLYGYSFRRANFSRVRFLPTETYDIGSLDASAILDTRDNPLNPRRGNFLSFSLEAGQRFLGSDTEFLKAFAKVSLSVDLGRSLIWAQGYRLGAIQRLAGSSVPDDILFRVGGPNSLRGIGTEALSSQAAAGDLALGEGVVIVNQELRYHHARSRLGAVVFYDTGNVFERYRDINFDLRHSVGFGLRYDSVIGLLRADVAFPLGRRRGERPYQFLFGLGQAF